MTKFILAPLLFFCMLPNFVAAASESEVRQFVDAVTSDIIAVVTSKSTTSQKADRLQNIFQSNSNPPAIARFVAGRYFRDASAADQERFVSLFERYMSFFYADAMQEYSGEELEISNVQDAGKKGFVVVSKVANRQPPLTVNWQVKPSKSGLKVIDLQVEGVSMLITWRNEFAAIIQNNGGSLAAASDDLQARLAKF